MPALALPPETCATVPFAVPSHTGRLKIDGHPCQLHFWTTNEWERLPARSRPKDALPTDDGFGYFALRLQD